MPTPVPSYRQHKPSGQAVVTLNGADFYLGPWNSPASRLEYDRRISEWLANGRQLPDAVPLGALSVVELADAFLEFAQGYYVQEGHTTKEYTTYEDLLKLVVELYGRVTVGEFGPLSLKAVREKLVQKGLVRQSINGHVHRIRRVFKWGVENQLVPALVLEGLRAVAPLKKGRTTAPESRKIKPVPDEHVDAVLPYVSRQVATTTAMRRVARRWPNAFLDSERIGIKTVLCGLHALLCRRFVVSFE
jgi:hypothetical protein